VCQTTGAIEFFWTLPAAMLAGAGRWFRLVLRAGPGVLPSSGAYVRPEIWDVSGLQQLWEWSRQLVNSTKEMWDLGSIPVPPGVWDTSYGPVRLGLWIEAVAGSPNFDVDYLAVLGMDGYRQIVQVGMQVPDNDAIELDEIEGRCYLLSGSTKYAYHTLLGPGLQVFPGVVQQLRVAEMVTTGSAAITRTMSVRAWYRPRRATV
jgi:hypothetical protein